jgi:hypothetical protein
MFDSASAAPVGQERIKSWIVNQNKQEETKKPTYDFYWTATVVQITPC